MGVEYRKDRNKWGYNFRRYGKRYNKFRWSTKAEAEKAFAELTGSYSRLESLSRTNEAFNQLRKIVGPSDLSGRFADFISPCVYAVTRWNEVLYVESVRSVL